MFKRKKGVPFLWLRTAFSVRYEGPQTMTTKAKVGGIRSNARSPPLSETLIAQGYFQCLPKTITSVWGDDLALIYHSVHKKVNSIY